MPIIQKDLKYTITSAVTAIQKTLDYRVKRIIVKIDSIDKSNLINFDSLEVQNNLYSRADACYFTYEKFGSRTYVPAGGDEIGDWDRGIKIFGGKITNVKVQIKGKVLVYDIECKDWVDQLDGELVSETYESQTVNQIVADLKSKYATTFDITNVNCTTNIEAIYFDMKPMSKCLDELAEIAGYHWYVDPDKKIYFFAEGSITSPFNVTDTNGKCLTQSLEIEDDYGQIKNRVNIQGGSIANVQVYDATSIAAYGEKEVIIRDDTLTSTAEATQKANAILAAFKDPIKKGSFNTYSAGLVAGQKININSSLRGINQDFIIQSVKFRARTPTDFIYNIQVMTQQDQGLIDLFEQEIMKPTAVTTFGNRDFTCNLKFTIVNYHKVEWDTGQIIMSSGEIYNIAAGDREFTNTEICYFKPSTSETVLQFSTTFGDGVGGDRVALGYAIPNPNTAEGAQFIPKGFMGGVRFWGGENIVARTIIAEQIGLNALTSDLVTTGEFITLSAQIKNAIINDAHINNLTVEKLTGTYLTGKIVRTAISGERIEMNAAAHNLLFYNAGGNIAGEIDSDGALNFGIANHINGGAMIFQLKTSGGVTRTPLEIRADGIIFLQGIAKAHFLPYDDVTYNLGSSSYKWSYLYVNYCATHFRPINNTFNLGDATYRWGNIYAVAGNFSGTVNITGAVISSTSVLAPAFSAYGGGKAAFTGTLTACPLPISVGSALDKIGNPKPTPYEKLKDKKFVERDIDRKDMGIERMYYDIEQVPKECRFINSRGKDDIEISRTVGFLYQCVIELSNKIKSLEQKK